ncbi:MAG TPA: AbrB/MazE/SpoVT family DNA-binding domain-containing protein [Polyangiaceae bacterium]|nr:AbrB/MazE/SpoVT family DNA-binding domain-containing protein [Polyangiaceae bacterium]
MLVVRKIGNSLGVIIPKSTLNSWGIREGGQLELTAWGIRPRSIPSFDHNILDEIKRKIALAVVTRCTANLIRAHSLANLRRWKQAGVWIRAYDEWHSILERNDDGELFSVLLGRDERSNRLRQSPPYVGLLPREEVSAINEETSP